MDKATIENMRLGIALPHSNRYFDAGFFDSFMGVMRPLNSIILRPRTHGPIDFVRNELVEMAQLHECTHIVFMDTDQVYP